MDAGGVDAAVIHPPGWDPGATAMAFAAVRTYPGRFAIMGAFPKVSTKDLETRHMQLGSGLIGPDVDRPGDDWMLCHKRVRYWFFDQENLSRIQSLVLHDDLLTPPCGLATFIVMDAPPA